MLQLRGVSKQYGKCLAVDGVNLEIPAGQMVGVIGRSGAGKSTLLRMINRLIDPSTGDISFEGKSVSALTGTALREWRASCAMIFQQFNLVGRLDVVTNVLVGRLNRIGLISSLIKRFGPQDRAMAIAALKRLDMDEHAFSRAERLSGGQQQRVAIARALVQEPRILLADEPIASLDPKSASQVMQALTRINREEGITVLCNLHHLRPAKTCCDRIIGMAQGRIVFDGTPEELTMDAVHRIYGMHPGSRELAEILDDSELDAPVSTALEPLRAVC
ncbi:MAG: phosphonate ABC transporter ATP-binding protein [Solidesulfovibrio sp.]